MTNRTQVNSTKGKEKTIDLLLPGHRGPYAVHDFRDIETRTAEKEIVDYLCRAACPFIRYRGGTLVLRMPDDAADDEESEQITEQAYRDLLVEWSSDAWATAWRIVPQALGLIAFGVTVLIAAHFLEAEQEGTLLGAMGSVLQVGGWVAMWTAISALFFKATTFCRHSVTLHRLSESPFRFEYADVHPHERFEHGADKLAPAGIGEASDMH